MSHLQHSTKFPETMNLTLVNSLSHTIDNINQKDLHNAYISAKKKSAELSALSIDSPPKFKSKLVLASKAHLAIATIIYTSLSMPLLHDLSTFVENSPEEIPKQYFNIDEWNEYLEQASQLRNAVNGKIYMNDFETIQQELNEIRKKNHNDLKELNNYLEKMKLQIINGTKSIELKMMSRENDFLANEINYKNEIVNLQKENSKLFESLSQLETKFQVEYATKSSHTLKEVHANHQKTLSELELKFNMTIQELEGKLQESLGLHAKDKHDLEDLRKQYDSLVTI